MISPDDGRVSYLTDAPVETVALCRSGELGGRTETAADATRLYRTLFLRLAHKLMSVDFRFLFEVARTLGIRWKMMEDKFRNLWSRNRR